MMEEVQVEQEAIEVVEEPQVEAPPEIDPETIAEAKKYGWREKETFDRAPEGWVDADRFLQLGATQQKMRRDDKREFERRLEDVRREAAKASKLAVSQVEASHKAELERIRGERRAAVEVGDVETYDKLQDKEIELLNKAPEPENNNAEQAERILSQKSWSNDPVMVAAASAAIDQGGAAVLKMDAGQQIEFAEGKLREYFPHKFEKPKPTIPRVDGGGLAAPKPKNGVNALPADAKKVGKEFVEQGLFKDLDAYAKAYFEGEE